MCQTEAAYSRADRNAQVLASPAVASTLDPDVLYACLVLCMALSGAATVPLPLPLSLPLPLPEPEPEPEPEPHPACNRVHAACDRVHPACTQVGFIGLALNLAVHIGAPVPEAYTVGGIEWLTQGVRRLPIAPSLPMTLSLPIAPCLPLPPLASP